ncbi:hypothetical protein PENTCL1PPCAC_843, partial [Pristionchus entomophagus]
NLLSSVVDGTVMGRAVHLLEHCLSAVLALRPQSSESAGSGIESRHLVEVEFVGSRATVSTHSCVL